MLLDDLMAFCFRFEILSKNTVSEMAQLMFC